MTPADAIQELLQAAAEIGARKALEHVTTGGPRMVPIRESRIPYRTALAAIREGSLVAYRVGKTTYVDRDDEDAWIARAEHRVRLGETTPDPEDEIGELIALSGRRRR